MTYLCGMNFIEEQSEQLRGYTEVRGLLCKLPKFGETVFRFPHSDSRLYYTCEQDPFIYSGLIGYIDKFYKRPGENKALDEWKRKQGDNAEDELEIASLFGSFGHMAIAKFLTEGMLDNLDLRSEFRQFCLHFGVPVLRFGKMWHRMWKAMQSFAQFVVDKNVVALATEYCVYSKELQIATPLDLICEMNFSQKRVIANINFKFRANANIFTKDERQVAIESFLFNSKFKRTEYEITHGFIWMPSNFRSTPTYKLENVSGKFTEAAWMLNHETLLRHGAHRLDMNEEYLSPNSEALKLGEAPNPTKETVGDFINRQNKIKQ